MRRLLLIMVFLTSLLGCVGTVVLWARSYGEGDSVFAGEPWDGFHEFWSADGLLSYRYQRAPIPDTRPLILYGPSKDKWMLTWEVNEAYGIDQHWACFAIRCPYWFIALACIAAIIACCARPCWHSCRRYLRQNRGCCLECGYDLRASPERCPECGTPQAGRQRTADETSAATEKEVRRGV